MFIKLRSWWNDDAQDDVRAGTFFAAGAVCGFIGTSALFAGFFLFLLALGVIQC